MNKYYRQVRKVLAGGMAAFMLVGASVPVFATSAENAPVPKDAPTEFTGTIAGVTDQKSEAPSIIITNRYRYGDASSYDREIHGAKFKIYKTATFDATGKRTAITAIQVGDEITLDGSSVTVKEGIVDNAEYIVVQSERAPGMRMGGRNLDENLEEVAEGTEATYKHVYAKVQFPLMENGVKSENQLFQVHPKFDPNLTSTKDNDEVEGQDTKVGFEKQVENESGELEKATSGIKFKFQVLDGSQGSPITEDGDIQAFKNATNAQIAGATQDTDYVETLTEKYQDVEVGENGNIIIENLVEGSYRVTETATLEKYALNTVNLDFDVTVDPTTDKLQVKWANSDAVKNQGATIEIDDATGKVTIKNYKDPSNGFDKDVKNGNEFVDSKNAVTGETVEFKITTKLPADINQYTEFSIMDYMPEGLTFIEADDHISGFKKGTDYTVSETDGTITFAFTADGIAKLEAGDFSIKLQAKVDNDVATGTTLTNEIGMTWDNGKGDKPEDPVIPEDENEKPKVTIKSVDFSFKKVDGQDIEKGLEGAEFTLYVVDVPGQEAGEVAKASDGATDLKVSSGTDGKISFANVNPGKYILKETKSPEGYKLVSAEYGVEIDHEDNVKIDTKTFEGNFKDLTDAGLIDDNTAFRNYKNTSWLPDTGTAGLIPYVLAFAGAAGAGSVMVLGKKRKEEDEE